MLTEAQVSELQERYKIPGLVDAFKAQEVVEVKLPEKQIVLSEAEHTTLKNNEYNNGKNAGVEMAIKDFKTKEGIDFNGKTLEGLVAAVKNKALEEAGKDPGEQVKDLQTRLSTLQQQHQTLQQTLSSKDGELGKLSTYNSILSSIPSLGEGATPVPKVIKLMEMEGYEFKNVDGKLLPSLNGQTIVDDMSNPKPIADVIKTFATENNMGPKVAAEKEDERGGRGGSNRTPQKFTKLSEFTEHYKASGKNAQGGEFMDALDAIRKDNPDFDMNG